MRSCALCKVPAKTFCESDQAALCWDCDAKVHGANFLVARHSRTLLCHACQCPTPWTASGSRLGHTVSVCHDCVNGVQYNDGAEEGNGDMPDDDDGGADGDRDDGDDDDDDVLGGDEDEGSGEDEDGGVSDAGGDEDGDNQVVPWSSATPPPAASSSSSDESVTRFHFGGKRRGGRTSSSSSSKPARIVSADGRSSQEDLDDSSSRTNLMQMATASSEAREVTAPDHLRTRRRVRPRLHLHTIHRRSDN